MKYFKVSEHLTFVKVRNPSRIGLYPVHLHKFPKIKKKKKKIVLNYTSVSLQKIYIF